jgi:hypothetical protein
MKRIRTCEGYRSDWPEEILQNTSGLAEQLPEPLSPICRTNSVSPRTQVLIDEMDAVTAGLQTWSLDSLGAARSRVLGDSAGCIIKQRKHELQRFLAASAKRAPQGSRVSQGMHLSQQTVDDDIPVIDSTMEVAHNKFRTRKPVARSRAAFLTHTLALCSPLRSADTSVLSPTSTMRPRRTQTSLCMHLALPPPRFEPTCLESPLVIDVAESHDESSLCTLTGGSVNSSAGDIEIRSPAVLRKRKPYEIIRPLRCDVDALEGLE